jgi:transcriptional regulator with XRE-family HTH domain
LSFYQRLERFRYPGESNREFAKRIGVRHPQIAMWKRADEEGMSGLNNKPSPKTLGVIAQNLNIDPGWLLWGDE